MKVETENSFPSAIPVMVLPDVCLFPNSLLPLYIFEPRYRQMLEDALETDRVFAVAMPAKELEGPTLDIAGAGIVRACVKNPDGTSNLMLQGWRRVRFTGWKQQKPYRIATVEPLLSTNKLAPQTAGLMAKIQNICTILQNGGVKFPQQFESYLHKTVDADVFCDTVASILIQRPSHRQTLLEELNVTTRMELLISFLEEEWESGPAKA